MSIYMISNRKVVNDKFSNVGEEKANREFRVASVTINCNSKKADYQILSEYDIGGYNQLINALVNNTFNKDKFGGTAVMFGDIYTKMLETKKAKQSDCLFFIHGFSYTLDDSLKHIKDLYDIYIQPRDSGIDHLVYVAWPTIGHKFGTYWDDQDDAEETGRVLGGLFSKLFTFFIELFDIQGLARCKNRIHLAAHSMGNTVLDHMLQTIPKHKFFNLFGEILLLYADVRHDIFENNHSFTNLDELGSRTHIYISKSDDMLGILSRYTKNFKRRLGHKGPKNLGVLDDQTFVVDTTDTGVANTLTEYMFDHWGYLHRSAVIQDIKQVLKRAHEAKISGRTQAADKRNYFELS